MTLNQLDHLAEGAPWVHHLLTHLYASIAYSLAKNKRLLTESSQEFCDVVQSLQTGSFPCLSTDQVRHISFALKKAARMVHHSKYKFIINLSMRKKSNSFGTSYSQIRPSSGRLPLPTLYHERQPRQLLETAASKESEATPLN